MTASDLESFLAGHAECVAGDRGGVAPRRLPAWAEAQHDRVDLRWGSRTPAGVRLRLRTRATRIRLRLHATSIELAGAVAVPRVTVVDGGQRTVHDLATPTLLRIDAAAQVVGLVPGADCLVEIERGGTGDELQVLLPHNAGVELLGLEADAPLAPGRPEGPRWVHYGSSISHELGAASPDLPWPVAVALERGLDLRNLAFSGNAQLDQFAARVIRDHAADLITLKVGINLVNSDSMREGTFRPAVHGFLDTIREGQPVTPVVVVTAVSCPLHEDTPGPVLTGPDGHFVTGSRRVEGEQGALTLRRTREIVAEVVDQRQRDGDRWLHLVDGRRLLGPDDVGHLEDALHPDPAGSRLIADRFWDALPTEVTAGLLQPPSGPRGPRSGRGSTTPA